MPAAPDDSADAPGLIRGTVVVTGAARGIGFAIAESLAARGAAVILADLGDAAAAPAETLRDRGFDTTPAEVDIADESSMNQLAELAAEPGDLSGWVNNAGVNALDPLPDLTLEEFRRMIEVNLVGCFLGTRAAAATFRGAGSIVNMSSVSGSTALAHNAHYGASKGGIESFSRHAAIDLAPRGIRVNCVAPGSVRTDMTSARYAEPGAIEKRVSGIPLGRVGEPADIAGPVAFLVSDDSLYVTGQTLAVDGGWLAAS